MDIRGIFETQAQLDAHIIEKRPEIKDGDNISWKVLALQVELGECANEWRGFKKWSNDQEPRNYCMQCKYANTPHACKNPLLEEFVDCLHFIVSIGLELDINPNDLFLPPSAQEDATDLFISLFRDIAHIDLGRKESQYKYTFIRLMELGLQLQFSFTQIEEAYYAKNKINHERQNNGY